MESTDCPRCGCNDVTTAGQGMRWGKPWRKSRCNHCGKTWSAAPEERPDQEAALPAVTYFVLNCPHCGSEKTRVTHTQRPQRYHECHDCRNTFKSYEKRINSHE